MTSKQHFDLCDYNVFIRHSSFNHSSFDIDCIELSGKRNFDESGLV